MSSATIRRTRVAKQRSVACRSCHARKVRCTGGRPCNNCSDASECVYPSKDRKVTVRQSYINELVHSNADVQSGGNDLLELLTPASKLSDSSIASKHGAAATHEAGETEMERNPLLQDQAWFSHLSVANTPIWIGEASDGAFATRFRQFASSPPAMPAHIPRTSYATDETLLLLSMSPPSWPSTAKARFLVEVAMRCLCRCFHVVLRSDVMAIIDRIAEDPSYISREPVLACKVWAVFAIGELHATKLRATSDMFPGLPYFARASSMLQIISERPHIDVVETMLLLVNRRHSALTLASSALRLAMVMGLHLNAKSCVKDPVVREHRNRVWWTAYIFDRMWASKLGLPTSLADEDILVDLPAPVTGPAADDFVGHEYVVAYIKLAKLAGEVITSIYGRRKQFGSFSRRVQHVLKELQSWAAQLPRHLRVDTDSPARTVGRPVSLHLNFNQCVILATRPVLLQVLRSHLAGNAEGDEGSGALSTARAIAEACIKCARHSHAILTETWINGSFHGFDFFFTQFLFSSATILAISSILPHPKSQDDADGFEVACDFLNQLKENGNFSAHEYCSHTDEIRPIVQQLRHTVKERQNPDPSEMLPMHGHIPMFDTEAAVTTESALAEQSLQDFLMGQDLDVDLLDFSMYDDELQRVYGQHYL